MIVTTTGATMTSQRIVRPDRRTLIKGIAALIAAPAIVRVESLMKLPRPELIRSPIYWKVVDHSFVSLAPYDGATLNSKPIYWPDGTPIGPGEIVAGGVYTIKWKDANWTLEL